MSYNRLFCALQSRPLSSSFNAKRNFLTSIKIVFLLSSLSHSCETPKNDCPSSGPSQLLGIDQNINHCHSAQHPISTTMYDRSKCIFCEICDDSSKEGIEKRLYSDDEIVVFRDIYPAATHHYLVVSREHIPTVKSLTKEQKPLLEKMILIAKQTLEKVGADMSDIRLGFHWPPFHSIEHIHLHAISPTKELSFVHRLFTFKENSWWFVSSDYALNRLSSD